LLHAGPSAASPIADAVEAAALSARDVSKTYRASRQPALDHVTLAVPAGRITALVGPNGAGKSTLIRSWLGFERPSAGSVRVLGNDPLEAPERAVALIGYVPQGGSLYRDLNLLDHLRFVAAYRPTLDVDFVMRRMADLVIPLDRRPTELSGGQQAQFGLAVALATDAPVLILDEPLASLDPLARREFIRFLAEMVRGAGRTVLLSSHVVSDVERVADRLVLLDRGRVAIDLEVADLSHSHALTDNPGGEDEVIGVMPTFDAETQVLVRRAPRTGAEAPTLEDVVIGYLNASRTAR
jgi:ABC-2 type transport system ATP-binding protein